MALPKLARMECVDCRSKGHHCQAQMFVDGLPMCLRCADGFPCYYETAQGVRHPDEPVDPFDGFTTHTGPRTCRATLVVPPIVPNLERVMIRAELRVSTAAEVARRHFLSVPMIEAVARDAPRPRILESRRQLTAYETVERQVANARRAAERRASEERDRRDRITIAEIQRVTASQFGTTVANLMLCRNYPEVVKPRQIAMFLAKRITGESLPNIGAAFGHKHHTTVMHSIRVIERELRTDETLQGVIRAVAAVLGAEIRN